MPTRTYSRKTAPSGGYSDPTRGDPSFTSGVLTAIPGRTWRTVASGADVTLYIDGEDLTAQEDYDLSVAHVAWVSEDHVSYRPEYPVITTAKGLVQKTDWYETDNGDGTYSGLAMREENTWSGGGNSVLVSTTTTRYAKDGSVLGKPLTDSYYTTSDGNRVKKVTYG